MWIRWCAHTHFLTMNDDGSNYEARTIRPDDDGMHGAGTIRPTHKGYA